MLRRIHVSRNGTTGRLRLGSGWVLLGMMLLLQHGLSMSDRLEPLKLAWGGGFLILVPIVAWRSLFYVLEVDERITGEVTPPVVVPIRCG